MSISPELWFHVCAVSFHITWWKIDWYPLLKAIVLINIGNSFRFPLSFPFKWCDCIPEVALFSRCYWSPCFLTQMPRCPNLPAFQGHANSAQPPTYSALTCARVQHKGEWGYANYITTCQVHGLRCTQTIANTADHRFGSQKQTMEAEQVWWKQSLTRSEARL